MSSNNGAISKPSGASAGGVRRRNTGGSGGAVQARQPGNNMLRLYTDDSPGLKITPVVVLLMSVCFIAFVTILHAVAKIYQYRSS